METYNASAMYPQANQLFIVHGFRGVLLSQNILLKKEKLLEVECITNGASAVKAFCDQFLKYDGNCLKTQKQRMINLSGRAIF